MLPVRRPDYAGWSTPARRIIRLAGELASELDRMETAPLEPADIRHLLDGMSGTAAALTRLLDELRLSPVLTSASNELGLPSQRTVLSELAQAAAAAEDLTVTAASLCRLLPREVP
ncbi:hypothetical protein [Amycolatopsis pigmentata]|uniref:Histidine kinase n=1 Tax=Amycolatopsis pigmentata TaxID=450801 RepID=A0ABW5FVP4_9PSEU